MNKSQTHNQYRLYRYKIGGKLKTEQNHRTLLSNTLIVNPQQPITTFRKESVADPFEYDGAVRTRIKRMSFYPVSHKRTIFTEQALPDKMDYQQTVEFIFESAAKSKVDNQKWKSRSRIMLPCISDNSSSSLTVFDPMPLHIEVIEDRIKEESCKMSQGMLDKDQFRQQLKRIQDRNTSDLDNINKTVQQKLFQFRNMIKLSNFNHQQSKLLLNDEITIVSKGLQELAQSFDQQLCKTQDLQQTIFNGLPFELVQEQPSLHSSFQQKLF